MTKTKRTWGVLLAALGWLVVGEAFAANPAYLNINVAVNANLSVSVNGVTSSTDTGTTWNTATPNDKFASVSSATVRNDSGGQTEKFALSTNGNSIDTGGGSPGVWTLGASSTTVGNDEFSLQAVFGSSNTALAGCPAATSGDWNQGFAPLLTTSPVTYTSTTFADSNLINLGGTPNPDVISGGANGRMFAGSRRALCWRIVTPNSTTTANTQNIQVIVTAQNP